MPIPAQLTVITVQEPLTAYRIVSCASVDDETLVESFKSNCDRGIPLRKNSAEASYRMVWQGVSMFATFDRASSAAQTFPKLGSYVASVDLQPGMGFSYALWGSTGHMSVWGDPARLAGQVADIVVLETP